MSISNYAEVKILEHMLRNTAWTSPTTVYVSLHTADPGETGASEVSGGSYARQSCAFAAATSGAGTIANSGALTFTMPAATVTHWAIWDASTAGNCLWTGAVAASQTYASGNSATVAAGALVLTLD